MKILSEIPDKAGIFSRPVLTIGSFDGVHAGHQKVFETLFIIAKEKNADPVVLTFESHPRKVLNPSTPPKILTTKTEKIKAILECGIENIIILQFTKAMAEMHADEFLKKMIIDKMGISHLVIGYDHAFGKNRSGDYNYLNDMSKNMGFEVSRVESRKYHSVPISSTWIRTEIEDGNISFANILLSRRYSLSGKIVRGEGRGAKLGFPTANIIPEDPDKVIPKDGVYAVKAVIDNIRKDGMINIGANPTFSNTERTIELNIFNFEGDIYGKTVEVDFYQRLRDEVKFDSPGTLKEQLYKDKQSAKELLKCC